jgi:DNA polymerase-3 subunit beta
MELTVTQENLARALGGVGRVASSKAGLPILGNILLRTDGTRLLVAATNLEIASVHHIGSKIITPGAITVPARLINEFISSLPSGTVELKVTDNKLAISAGHYSSVINGIVADEFPELPTIEEDTSLLYRVSAADFKQAVTQTIITAGSDSTRPVLTGVFWQIIDGMLYLAATDGYRLAERSLMPAEGELAAIIPATTLQEVLRTLHDDTDEIEMLFDETQVRFRMSGVEITSRLIDGKYPDYRQLIPPSSDSMITINTAEFTRITKIAGLFARASGGSITLTADSGNQTLSIHSIASELGENTSTAEAKIEGDGQVTLNSRYLSDALSVVDAATVTFRFSGKLSACVLTPADSDSQYTHIIMPLKS